MMKILVGYDGSESAEAALKNLRRAGLPSEAEALVVSVAEISMMPLPSSYEVVGQVLTSRRVTSAIALAESQIAVTLKGAKELAAKASDLVQSYFPDWAVRAETLGGLPSSELVRKADEWEADLVVVGSQGRSAFGRFVLGSVSKTVVTDSDHSVRVTRGAVEKNVGKPPRVVIGIDGSSEAENAVRALGRRIWLTGLRCASLPLTTAPLP